MEDSQNSVEIDWDAEVAKARNEVKAGTSNPAKSKTKKEKSVTSNGIEILSNRLDAFMTPENFRGIVTAPANFMLMKTGHPHWNLPKDDVDMLAFSGCETAKYFVHCDPKWVALTMFMFNVSMVYGTRLAEDAKIYKTENLAKEKVAT